jgi:hypothetical protein
MKPHDSGSRAAGQWVVELDELRRSIAEDMANHHRASEAAVALDEWRDVERRWRNAAEGSSAQDRLAGELGVIRQRYLDAVAAAKAHHESNAPTITGVPLTRGGPAS